MDDDEVADFQGMMLAERLTAKQDAFQAPVVVSQAEVDVSRRRATQIADFAFEPEVRIQGVRFERLAEKADKCSDREQPGSHARSLRPAPRRIRGEPYSTGCPLPTRIASTMPARSAVISFMIFIASMMPIVWPI
jgi:hypothetical protein